MLTPLGRYWNHWASVVRDLSQGAPSSVEEGAENISGKHYAARYNSGTGLDVGTRNNSKSRV